MKLYPIKFNPSFKEKIWGNRRLSSFMSTRLPAEKQFGEVWHTVDRENDQSQVQNGWYQDKTLHDLVQEFPDQLLGTRIMPDSYERFPLISKFLSIEDALSIQVHPPGDYAQHKENDEGKIEAWYILEASEDAQIIRGVLPNIGPEDLLQAIKEDRPKECLNTVPARQGDVVLIPPRMIHSIEGEVLLYEIGQNSDVTYRLYDWNRLTEDGTTRKLNLEKGIDLVDFEAMGRTRARSSDKDGPGDERKILVRCTKFILEKIGFSRKIKEQKTTEQFELIVPIKGSGNIVSKQQNDIKFSYERGECLLIPGGMENYELVPNKDSTVLKVIPTR